jgi:succinate dehydrogenase/fumarate reductase flavoprotein subunit
VDIVQLACRLSLCDGDLTEAGESVMRAALGELLTRCQQDALDRYCDRLPEAIEELETARRELQG